MVYEKPTRSAGLIVAGMLSVVAGQLVNILARANADSAWVTIGWVLQIAGAASFVLGVGVLTSALDAALLHHWTRVRDAELDAATARGQQRTEQA